MLVAAPEKGIEEGFEVTRVTLLPFFRASLSDPFKEQEHKDFCVTLKTPKNHMSDLSDQLEWIFFSLGTNKIRA